MRRGFAPCVAGAGPHSPGHVIISKLPALAILFASALGAQAGTQTFSYTGTAQTFVVPANVTAITVSASGAQGGAGDVSSVGGNGGTTTATIPVTPGEMLTLMVGGAGGPGTAAGFNGGAIGGSSPTAGGGGGATDVRQGGNAIANRVVVAGGGGGGGGGGGTSGTIRARPGNGGAGGGLNGQTGQPGEFYDSGTGTGYAGGPTNNGGTQSEGGFAIPFGSNGTLANGGAGGTGGGGGGGGGGYYGGGGNGQSDSRAGGGGGGGGSAYTIPAATAPTLTQGDRAGNGQVVLSWQVLALTVTNDAELRAALTTIDDGGTITFANDITLAGDLPAVQKSITIDGASHALDGNNLYRGLFFAAWTPGTATFIPVTASVENLTIRNCTARGGLGGGAGLGGAIFVANQGHVALRGVSLTGNAAAGGNGSGPSGFGGGGGGMGGYGAGRGGQPTGGGGLGIGANAVNSGRPSQAGPIALGAASAGGSHDRSGTVGGPNGGGGGVGGTDGIHSWGGGGGGGGVGGGVDNGVTGGSGGFGGGGGAGGIYYYDDGGEANGGAGGFGGGGGVSGWVDGVGPANANGGAGGFGGGGGGGRKAGGAGGFGGGAGGDYDSGGGGAGMGGAIFVMQGGSLTLTGSLSINGNTVTGGTGFANGSAFGSGIFAQGGNALLFSPAAGETQTISDGIADQIGSGGGSGSGVGLISKNGAGTLVLAGTNPIADDIGISGGTLLLSGTITAANGIYVGTDGVLGGSGTTAGLVSFLGTLNADAGPLHMGAIEWVGGTLAATLSPTSQALSVTGAISKSAGGNTIALTDGGVTPGTTYTLLTFGSNAGLVASDFTVTGLTGTLTLEANALKFTTTPIPPTYGVAVSVAKGKNRATFTITNTGSTTTNFALRRGTTVTNTYTGPKPPSGGTSPILITYSLDGRNITSAIDAQTASVTLSPGGTANVVVKIKVRNGRTILAKRIVEAVLAASSEVDPSQAGSARAKFVLKAGTK